MLVNFLNTYNILVGKLFTIINNINKLLTLLIIFIVNNK